VATPADEPNQQGDTDESDDCRNGKDLLELGHSWRFSQTREAPQDVSAFVRHNRGRFELRVTLTA